MGLAMIWSDTVALGVTVELFLQRHFRGEVSSSEHDKFASLELFISSDAGLGFNEKATPAELVTGFLSTGAEL